MKKKFLALLALGALLFTGCNSIGDKDTIIGRVNGESIYQEDIDLMVRLHGESSKSEHVKSSIARSLDFVCRPIHRAWAKVAELLLL